jgi:ABC-type glycerol-3-phosphate transport system substrate-binding protein
MKKHPVFLIVWLLFLTACGELPSSGINPTPTAAATSTRTPLPHAEATPTRGPVTLRVWLPPQFDPSSDLPASQLLQERLNEFTARRPDVHLEVRIKAQEGPGGLLDALTTASAAAPLALPDLVAVPRPILEAGALKGLLHPYDAFTQTLDGEDWYEYARQMGRLQNSTFGLPFAGDALLLVHRTAAVSEPPRDLASAMQASGPLVFPAADPQALFTLALYQAAGGGIQDGQERPFLDTGTLLRVLSFYQEAENSKLLPFWLTQYQSDDQAWQAFQNSQGQMVITWASRYLNGLSADIAAAPIPTPSGEPFTLATGWVWALASPDPDHQVLSAELAEFLTESGFLAQWTAAAGYLPPRPSALEAWPDPTKSDLAAEIVTSAHLYPSADILTSLASPLQKATTEVLKQQVDPQTAAEEASNSLAAP